VFGFYLFLLCISDWYGITAENAHKRRRSRDKSHTYVVGIIFLVNLGIPSTRIAVGYRFFFSPGELYPTESNDFLTACGALVITVLCLFVVPSLQMRYFKRIATNVFEQDPPKPFSQLYESFRYTAILMAASCNWCLFLFLVYQPPARPMFIAPIHLVALLASFTSAVAWLDVAITFNLYDDAIPEAGLWGHYPGVKKLLVLYCEQQRADKDDIELERSPLVRK